jgi:hypothetical protein
VTLLEAPEPPPRLPSNSLLADSVARLVSAATVEAMLAAGLAVELEVLFGPAAVLAGVAAAAAATLLPMLPIDIMGPDRDCWNQGYRPGFEELEELAAIAPGDRFPSAAANAARVLAVRMHERQTRHTSRTAEPPRRSA